MLIARSSRCDSDAIPMLNVSVIRDIFRQSMAESGAWCAIKQYELLRRCRRSFQKSDDRFAESWRKEMVAGNFTVGGREVSCAEGVCPEGVDGRRWG